MTWTPSSRGASIPPTTSTRPCDEAEAWPSLDEVVAYRDRVRAALPEVLDVPGAREVAAMVLEHELMHHETLLYMVQQLPAHLKRGPDLLPASPGAEAPRQASVPIPAGTCVLGAPRDGRFRWDNEHPELEVEVPAFRIDALPVTNREYREFVEDGGYDDRRLWTAGGLGLDQAPRSPASGLLDREPGSDPGPDPPRRSGLRRGRRLARLGRCTARPRRSPDGAARGCRPSPSTTAPRSARPTAGHGSTPGAMTRPGPSTATSASTCGPRCRWGRIPPGPARSGSTSWSGTGGSGPPRPSGPSRASSPWRATRATPPTSSTTGTS